MAKLELILRGLYKRSEGFKTQARYRYRKGVRGRWSEAFAPVEGGAEALATLLGPIVCEPMPDETALAMFVPAPLPPAPVVVPVAPPTVLPGAAFAAWGRFEPGRMDVADAEDPLARSRPWQREWEAVARAARDTRLRRPG